MEYLIKKQFSQTWGSLGYFSGTHILILQKFQILFIYFF